MGVRPSRKGREAWADYQKPLTGLRIGHNDHVCDVKDFQGIPNVSKISDTSAGMNMRRDMVASSAVIELSSSKSFILRQAERGAMAGKYI